MCLQWGGSGSHCVLKRSHWGSIHTGVLCHFLDTMCRTIQIPFGAEKHLKKDTNLETLLPPPLY